MFIASSYWMLEVIWVELPTVFITPTLNSSLIEYIMAAARVANVLGQP